MSEDEIYYKYGVLVGAMRELQRVAETDRNLSPLGRNREMRKIILGDEVQRILGEEYGKQE